MKKKWVRVPGKNWRHDIWSLNSIDYLIYRTKNGEIGWYFCKSDGTGKLLSRYLDEAKRLVEEDHAVLNRSQG